jgi:ribonuclease R
MNHYRFPEDPFAEREAQKYDTPLPSREYILQILEEEDKPLTLEQLVDFFGLEEDELAAFEYRLRAMERDAQVVRNRRGGYGLLDKMSLVAGRVIAHRDGYGFLIPDDNSPDFYLSHYEMRQVFHNDRVLVRELEQTSRSGREGSIVRVLERNTEEVVGRYFEEHGMPMLSPENKHIVQDIFISKDSEIKVKSGQMVVAQLIQYPSKKSRAIAKITEVLGEHMAPGMEIDVAIRAYQLPHTWSLPTLEEVKDLKGEVLEKDKLGREDLRLLPLVTIDGATARDFDDAVYCEKLKNGEFKLLVAIADVSHYVKPDTALDADAFARGNSVYFPDNVIPMLPTILSNELCSLNPKVDRLCMVCEAVINKKGEIKKTRFFQGLMRSHARLTYTKVADYLEGAGTSIDENLLSPLDTLYELFKILLKQRETRGAISFETQETEIIFDKNRKIENIVPVSRNIAHQLIEECMLVANVAAAEYLAQQKLPLLYRVHDRPTPEKLLQLRAFLQQLGLTLGGGDKPTPKDYSKLLALTRQREDAHLLQTVLLRSMAQAQYSPDNIGHFGLAYEAYTHFTSPIRRYPDLLVHRAICAALQNKKREMKDMEIKMQLCAEHCSMTERRADDATRDVTGWLKCEYMLDKVGDTFPGIISGVTGFGFFVELKDIYVEGLVHVSTLSNDYYTYDEKTHSLCAKRSNKKYSLGDPITVRVARVDLDERKIDFEMPDTEGNTQGKNKPRNTQKKTSDKKRTKRRKTSPKKKSS